MGRGTTQITLYRNHREALKGSFLWPFGLITKQRGVLLVVSSLLCAVLPNFLSDDPLRWTTVLLIPVWFWLVAWPTGGIVLYVVNALAGGVMSRDRTGTYEVIDGGE